MNWVKLLNTKRVSEFESCSAKVKSKSPPGIRSAYEKDWDQIIFSYPFRRLQDKTQVIPFPKYDFVHTRLTHSLEVASIGRSLGKMAAKIIFKELNDNPEGKKFLEEEKLCPSDIGTLVGAACLAHDIGNPPFGHSGEDAIRNWFRNHFLSYTLDSSFHDFPPNDMPDASQLRQIKQSLDFSNYEGNATGFRILTKNCIRGINPTSALLGVFTKYPRESYYKVSKSEKPKLKDPELNPHIFKKTGIYQSERKIFEEVASNLGLIPKGDKNFVAFSRHPLAFLMEAADDIAYKMIDFEDGIRLGLIDFEKKYSKVEIFDKERGYISKNINETPLEILQKICGEEEVTATVTEIPHDKGKLCYLRAKVIDKITNLCFEVFQENYELIMQGVFQEELIKGIDSEILNEWKKLGYLVKSFVYSHTAVLESEASGFEVMEGLLNAFSVSSAICFSCGDSETLKDKKFRSLLPKEFMPGEEKKPNELSPDEIYDRMMKVLDYVGGMTDKYAVSLYRRIKGIQLPEK